MKTVAQASRDYLSSVALARSVNTARTYRQAMGSFQRVLEAHDVLPDRLPAQRATEDWIRWFLDSLKANASATERLYLTAVSGWYEYLIAEGLAEVNLPRLKMLIRRRARKPGQRLPQFPRSAIEEVLRHAEGLSTTPGKDEKDHLRSLRDRAFLLTLADTGLRVHEACRLRRGDIDWQEAQALLIGKGDRQAVVRFSQRSLRAMKAYLRARNSRDGATGRPLSALPLFARHDRGAGKKVISITPTTGRAIVHQHVSQALGPEAVGSVTPHSFRHFFVTTVLRGSGGNLKLAQELARHRNIAVTQRYAHLSDDELDRGYHDIFDAGAK
ncbi:MAG TPA: tyrosine-type recombinase/integrase [Anaerolineales bacterium]|nr:tyrosine-type recombinase/integrase [Anaerolineales bacterium]